MKGLMEVLSCGSDILKEWRLIGLLKGYFYVGRCPGSDSVGRQRKTWIDTVKECLKKRFLDVGQARRIEHDRNEWRGFIRGNA